VQRIQGISKVPKIDKSCTIEEEIGAIRSRGLRERTLEGFSREKKGLREVMRREISI
jgi:hypothetical protein